MSVSGVPSVEIQGAANVVAGGTFDAGLVALAAAGSATVPGAVDAASAAQIATLGGLTGQAFDLRYARDQIARDQTAVNLAATKPSALDNLGDLYPYALLQQAITEYARISAGLTDATAAPTTFAGSRLANLDAGAGPIADADGSNTPPAAAGGAIHGIQFVNANATVAANYGAVRDAASIPVTVNGAADFGTENPGFDQVIDVLGNTAGLTYYGAAGGYASVALTGGTNLLLSGLAAADVGTCDVGAQGGDNTIYAGNGDDVIATTGGRNLIGLGDGANEVISGADDIVLGSSGHDTVFATAGSSMVFAGSKGITFVAGGTPVFGTIVTDAGGAVVYGGSGSDLQLTGAVGGDIIVAGGGNETLTGAGLTGRANTFFAGSGADAITGGPADTAYVLGSGNATISGGSGANLFQFVSGHAGGGDVIAFDFSDVIALSSYAAGTAAQVLATQTRTTGAVSFTLPDNTHVTLTGIAPLAASNFI